VAFTAKLVGMSGGAADVDGIFVSDPALKLIQVVRSGIKVGSETLSEPTFLNGPNPGGVSGFNDYGDLAFWAELNGNPAVFFWSEFIITDVLHVGDAFQMSFSLPSGTTSYVQATRNLNQPFQNIAGPFVATGRRIQTNFFQKVPTTKTNSFYRLIQAAR